MTNINIIGTIFGSTGYDIHTRELANALYKIDKSVKLSVPLMPDWQRYTNDAEFDMITKLGEDDQINLIIAMPQQWKLHCKPGRNWAYCIWEGDRVPESFIDDFLNPNIEYIFVASEHTKNAIWTTIGDESKSEDKLMDKIKIMPHGVDTTKFFKKEVKRSDKFTFISSKGWRGTTWDRGGVQYLLQAFAEEFSKDENVELFLKLNPAYINTANINGVLEQLNLPKDRPNIKLGNDNILHKNLNEFYNQGDVFICPTRAEAFNLPGIESMGCGLPTIQTNFGGQTDYVTEKNGWLIDYKLEDIKEDIMYEEVQWATPDMKHLKKTMRYCFEHQDEVKKKGKQALEDAKKWSWENTAKKINNLKGG